MAPIIRTEKLRKVYAVGKERVVALNNVDLSIEKGEFCCIVGQSGSGKSTLLNQLAGLEKPSRGSIVIAGEHLEKMNEKQLVDFRLRHIGFIFQQFNLFPSRTAVENVTMPLVYRGVGARKRKAAALKMLKDLGLSKHVNHRPSQMSGGQQQRVGIARAFVSSPKVILPMSRQETSTPAQASRCCTACWKCPKTAVSRSLWSLTSRIWPSARTAL